MLKLKSDLCCLDTNELDHKRPKSIISNKALHSLKLGQLSLVYLMPYHQNK